MLAPRTQTPEILRVPLEQLCLKIKATGQRDVEPFVASLLDPPSAVAVAAGLRVLKEISAVDEAGEILALGRHIVEIPADVHLGKMLIFGALLGCLDPVLTIVACLAHRTPFLTPFDQRDAATAAKRRLATSKSDLLAYVTAFDGWQTARMQGRGAERHFCDTNFLSLATLYQVTDLRRDLFDTLVTVGVAERRSGRVEGGGHALLGGEAFNANATDDRLVRSVVCAGLYPKVARIAMPPTVYMETENGSVAKPHEPRTLRFLTRDGGRVFLHPNSVNFTQGTFEQPFVVFNEKVATAKVLLRDCTMVSAYALLFFGGELRVAHEDQQIVLESWFDRVCAEGNVD